MTTLGIMAPPSPVRDPIAGPQALSAQARGRLEKLKRRYPNNPPPAAASEASVLQYYLGLAANDSEYESSDDER
jgi:hypothetical protein